MDESVVLLILALFALYYYSNPFVARDVQRRGTINVHSPGEEDEIVPIGSALGSMTFQVHSPSFSTAWYA